MSASTPQPTQLKSLAELQQLLEDFDMAMLVTREADGGMHARPMLLQNPDEMPGCDLWFVSSSVTPKVREIEREEQVAVCCFRSSDATYVSIQALARIESDKDELRRVYRPEWRMWMQGGPADPDGVIIKLTVLRAERWTNEGDHFVLHPEEPRQADGAGEEVQVGV